MSANDPSGHRARTFPRSPPRRKVLDFALVLVRCRGPMERREFISLVGGVAAWPLTARAQQGERMRRIGVLVNVAEDDLEAQAENLAFLQGLQQLGWTDGRN